MSETPQSRARVAVPMIVMARCPSVDYSLFPALLRYEEATQRAPATRPRHVVEVKKLWSASSFVRIAAEPPRRSHPRSVCVVKMRKNQGPSITSLCEEVGVVKGVHLLSGEVRSVTTALKVVEEVQEEVQEKKDE